MELLSTYKYFSINLLLLIFKLIAISDVCWINISLNLFFYSFNGILIVKIDLSYWNTCVWIDVLTLNFANLYDTNLFNRIISNEMIIKCLVWLIIEFDGDYVSNICWSLRLMFKQIHRLSFSIYTLMKFITLFRLNSVHLKR